MFGIFRIFSFHITTMRAWIIQAGVTGKGTTVINDDKCNSAYDNDSDNTVKQSLYRPGEALRAPAS